MKLFTQIFEQAAKSKAQQKQRQQATEMKDLGNQALQQNLIEEAIMYYTKSIVSNSQSS